MSWLTTSWSSVGFTAAKAGLMYATALFGLRIAERRTLAQWTAIDFVAAVAVGAIVGRTAIASTQSYEVGAVALISVIAMHRVASAARFRPALRKLVDHRVRVLAVDGSLRRRQLRICGLTEDDLYAALRQRGVFELSSVKFVLYESKGDLTIVTEPSPTTGDVLERGLQNSIGYQRTDQ